MSYIIFTDGSSRGNPGVGGYGAIIFDGTTVREIGGREEHTTNNRMEMIAALEALKSVSDDSEIHIYTDSAYLVNGITKWVYGWQKNNWKTQTKEDVLNSDLWEELLRVSEHKKIMWKKISGHSGVPGNERCDEIATSFADNVSISLFQGSAEKYTIDLTVMSGTEEKIKSKSNKKISAYSYVSLVDGVIQTHETWAECEQRVKGKSDARFKKSISEEDEAHIIADFKRLM